MLAGAGLGDDAGLAHALGQQCLAQNVVDLVRAGVVEVFALEEDPGAAGVGAEALGLGEQRGAAGVVLVQLGDFGQELGINLGLFKGFLKLVQGRDEGFGHPAAAVAAKVGSGGMPQGMLRVVPAGASPAGRLLPDPPCRRDPETKLLAHEPSVPPSCSWIIVHYLSVGGATGGCCRASAGCRKLAALCPARCRCGKGPPFTDGPSQRVLMASAPAALNSAIRSRGVASFTSASPTRMAWAPLAL